MANAKKTADTEVDKIVRKVQEEMQVLVKAYGEELSKVHPGEETSDESKPDESASAPAPAEDSASAGAPPSAPPSDGPPADASAGAPPPGGDAPPAGGPGDPAADAGGGPPDPMALEAEFDKMPVPEAMAYYQAVKASLAKRMGAGAGGAGAASAGAPPAAPAPDASAPPSGPPAMKSEPVMKSEAQWKAEYEAVQAKAEASATKAELDKAIKALNDVSGKLTKYETELKAAAKMVEGFRTAPSRKAITGISDLAKSEPSKTEDAEDPRETLTADQMSRKLRELARSPGLSKSDRTAVGNYAAQRTNDNFTKIKHLFAAPKAAA